LADFLHADDTDYHDLHRLSRPFAHSPTCSPQSLRFIGGLLILRPRSRSRSSIVSSIWIKRLERGDGVPKKLIFNLIPLTKHLSSQDYNNTQNLITLLNLLQNIIDLIR
jgi:hypothetical protein